MKRIKTESERVAEKMEGMMEAERRLTGESRAAVRPPFHTMEEQMSFERGLAAVVRDRP